MSKLNLLKWRRKLFKVSLSSLTTRLERAVESLFVDWHSQSAAAQPERYINKF